MVIIVSRDKIYLTIGIRFMLHRQQLFQTSSTPENYHIN